MLSSKLFLSYKAVVCLDIEEKYYDKKFVLAYSYFASIKILQEINNTNM